MTIQNRRAFVFDMDGTIVDNMAFHTRAWLDFFASFDMPMTAEEVHRRTSGTIEESIRRNLGDHLSEVEVAELGNRKESLYRDSYHPHLQLILGLCVFRRR